MNLCSGCKEDFGSVSAFDAHRTGSYAYPFSQDHLDGRRCLDTEELAGKGWKQDSRGRWRTPSEPRRLPLLYARQKASLRFAVSPNRPLRAQGGGQG